MRDTIARVGAAIAAPTNMLFPMLCFVFMYDTFCTGIVSIELPVLIIKTESVQLLSTTFPLAILCPLVSYILINFCAFAAIAKTIRRQNSKYIFFIFGKFLF